MRHRSNYDWMLSLTSPLCQDSTIDLAFTKSGSNHYTTAATE